MLVIALSSPLLVGIYSKDKLIKSYDSLEPASEALPKIFKEILEEFLCEELFYAKGPGSFMAIKVSFVYLRSLQIVLDIPLFACDGFAFNQNTPIKALGSQWFFKEKDSIVLGLGDGLELKAFKLPSALNRADFSDDNAPLYVLSAV